LCVNKVNSAYAHGHAMEVQEVGTSLTHSFVSKSACALQFGISTKKIRSYETSQKTFLYTCQAIVNDVEVPITYKLIFLDKGNKID